MRHDKPRAMDRCTATDNTKPAGGYRLSQSSPGKVLKSPAGAGRLTIRTDARL